MTTLSLAMIVKNEGATIERVLACARPFCDELIVVDTGSTDDTVAKATAFGATVHHFKWVNDFAAARNFAFSKCTQDWIIWLDGDDIITKDNQRRIIDIKQTVLSVELEAIYLSYDYPPFIQRRERMIRRDLFGTKLKWEGAIHECVYGIDSKKVRYFDDVFIQHDTPPERMEGKKDRNITILREQLARGANDERTLYLYAVECLHGFHMEEAPVALEKFFASVRYSGYRYEVYCKMYNAYVQLGRHKDALQAVTNALVEEPSRAEAYYKLGTYLYEHQEKFESAIPLLHVAAGMPKTLDGIPEIEAYSHGPWSTLCRIYFCLEQFDKAKEMAMKALTFDPPDREWLEKLVTFDPSVSEDKLTGSWAVWVRENLQLGVSRRSIIYILLKERFSPSQIIASLLTT